MLAVKMILLADKEPASRTAWLMACDQVEREMAGIFAGRLRLPGDGLQVRLHAAAASAALRVINEDNGATLLAGTDPREVADAPERVARPRSAGPAPHNRARRRQPRATIHRAVLARARHATS
ncbi:hypothetical protein [Streptomyces sp. Inha503]|uniref:hypothetical protein n=1 Tax=Streptomyces sp. Inha503 TaxID=3383314 RepID=UPI0039A2D3B2